MKTKITLILLIAASTYAVAQQPNPQSPEPNVPAITLEEKISLTTDDVKIGDALENAKKAYIASIKSIYDHQEATKAVIEKEHPGWILERGPEGWHLTKKPEPAKPEPKTESPKTSPAAKK